MNRLLLILWSLGPMLWQLYTSFRPNATLTGNPMQGGWTLEHYQALLGGNPPFWRYLLNSGVVGLSSTLLTLVVAVPCSYGLSRLGRKTGQPQPSCRQSGHRFGLDRGWHLGDAGWQRQYQGLTYLVLHKAPSHSQSRT